MTPRTESLRRRPRSDASTRSRSFFPGRVAVLLLSIAIPAAAGQPHPILQEGFNPEQVYALGDVDDVNLFNGDLVVPLPLGPQYPIRDGFSYGLVLAYNSQTWAFTSCPGSPDIFACDVDPTDPVSADGAPGTIIQGLQNPRNNAGGGWRLTTSFGELYGPSPDDPAPRKGGFSYVEPNGAVRTFEIEESRRGEPSSQFLYPRYTYDGRNMLRLTVSQYTVGPEGDNEPSEVELERPDGLVVVFSRPLASQVPQAPHGRWHLEAVRDRFGTGPDIQVDELMTTRTVQVDNGASTKQVWAADRWVIQDRHGRTQTVVFEADAILGSRVASVSVSGFGGTLSTYLFGYPEFPAVLIPGCPHNRTDDLTGASDPVPLVELAQVTRPDGTAWSFEYLPRSSETTEFCSYEQGRLSAITLPTGGRIEYGYGRYFYPRPGCQWKQNPTDVIEFPRAFVSVAGVTSRTWRAPDGQVVGSWLYRNSLLNWGGLRRVRQDNDAQCELPDVVYTDVYEPVQGSTYRLTRHFFAVHSDGDSENLEGWNRFEYGLSLDRYSPDPYPDPALQGPLFRSSMTFKCQGDPATYDYAVPAGTTWEARKHLWVPPQCLQASFGASFATPAEVHGLRDRYVRYTAGSAICDTGGTECGSTSGRKVATSVSYFYDDLADGVPHRSSTERTDPDGFGHFRLTFQTSDFFNKERQKGERTERTQYNDGRTGLPAATDPWILDTYAYRETTESVRTWRDTYAFDSSTGFLLSHTTRRGGGLSPLVATFTDTDGDGDPDIEDDTGGDAGAGTYRLVDEHQGGVLRRREYRGAGGATILRTVDAEIDTATGLPATSWDSAGVRKDYLYDSLWRLTSITPTAMGVAADAGTTYEYVPASGSGATFAPAQVVVYRGASLTTTTLTFDGFGRLVRQESLIPGANPGDPPAKSVQTTTYTSGGLVATRSTLYGGSGAAPGETVFTYDDAFGRPTRIVGPDGARTDYLYAGTRFKRRKIRDVASPDGPWARIDVFLYNPLGQLIEVENKTADATGVQTGNALTTDYTYGERGLLDHVTQGQQNRFFLYDQAGLLTTECQPELGFTGTVKEDCGPTAAGALHYSGFDARGHPTVKRLGAGGSLFDVSMTYDRAERLVQVRRLKDGAPIKELYFTNLYGQNFGCAAYEDFRCAVNRGNGKLFQTVRHNSVTAGDVVVTETNDYAGRGGRLSRQTLRTGGAGAVPRVRFISGFTYDPLGNLGSIDYPACPDAWCVGEPARTVAYTYDQGMLTGVSAQGQTLASLDYHPNLAVHRVTHGNGVVDVFDPDPELLPRPAAIRVLRGTTSLWDSGPFTYDGSGNVAAIGSTAASGDSFTYDPIFNRLAAATVHYPQAGATASESRAYGYDLHGNLESISSSGGVSRSVAADPATNRLTGAGYDSAGNLTVPPSVAGSWSYAYDPFNRLSRAVSGLSSQQFLYTASGERVGVLFNGGTRELWSVRGVGDRVLRDFEHLSTGWGWLEDYVFRGSQLLATFDAVQGGDEVRHDHLNHLGSPRLITDAAGAVVAEHVYAPFGEELTDPGQDEERLRFTGHERDDLDPDGQAGDLDYLHARHYSPWLGRFASLDPVSRRPPTDVEGAWNLYRYALNNPLRMTDPDGRGELPIEISPYIGIKVSFVFGELKLGVIPGKLDDPQPGQNWGIDWTRKRQQTWELALAVGPGEVKATDHQTLLETKWEDKPFSVEHPLRSEKDVKFLVNGIEVGTPNGDATPTIGPEFGKLGVSFGVDVDFDAVWVSDKFQNVVMCVTGGPCTNLEDDVDALKGALEKIFTKK